MLTVIICSESRTTFVSFKAYRTLRRQAVWQVRELRSKWLLYEIVQCHTLHICYSTPVLLTCSILPCSEVYLFSNQSVLHRSEVQATLFKFLIRVKYKNSARNVFSNALLARFLTLLHSVFVYVSPYTAQELKQNIDSSFQTFSNKCLIEYF
jgi:hypothetical protein